MSKKKSTAIPKDTAVKKSKIKQIYLGPTIPGVVRHATVFSGKLPPALDEAISDTPTLCRLIASIDDAAALIKELNNKQSAAANIYKTVAEKYLH